MKSINKSDEEASDDELDREVFWKDVNLIAISGKDCGKQSLKAARTLFTDDEITDV